MEATPRWKISAVGEEVWIIGVNAALFLVSTFLEALETGGIYPINTASPWNILA